MLDTSSLGRAQPRTKTINVEANLLSERTVERARIAEGSRKRLFCIGLVLTVLALIAPALYRLQGAAARRAQSALAVAGKLDGQLAELERRAEDAQPKVDDDAIVQSLRSADQRFLSQCVSAMNSTTSGVAISGLRAEIAAGSMLVKVAADAESFEQAQAFLANIKESSRVKEAFLSSARASKILGENGFGFDLQASVEWRP